MEESRSEGSSEAASEESPCEERRRKRTRVGEEYLESRDMGMKRRRVLSVEGRRKEEIREWLARSADASP